jgi:hypothetical protein
MFESESMRLPPPGRRVKWRGVLGYSPEAAERNSMTNAMVRVAFKDGYALTGIADRVRVKLEPEKARELALALLDAASRAEGGKETKWRN